MIDAHIHLTDRYSSFGSDFIVDQNVIRDMLKIFEKVLIMPMLKDSDNSVELNKTFISSLKSIPRDRYFYFLFLHPEDISEDIIRMFDTDGIKFHAGVSQKKINEIPLQLDIINTLGLPVLHHCGRDKKSRIEYVLDVCKSYPNINFICAHLGGLAMDIIFDALKLLSQGSYENIYLDTSGCVHPSLIKKAVEVMGEDKIIFGSDLPFFDYQICLHALQLCGFPKSVEKKILSNNILHALNIS